MTANQQLTTTAERFKSIREHLYSRQGEFQAALPKGLIDPVRFLRVVLTNFQLTPKLLNCTPASVYSACLQAAQYGLELDPVLGQAYLVPYKETCQLILGYQGLIQLMLRDPSVLAVVARAVYQGDTFEVDFGYPPKLSHKPGDDDRSNPKNLVGAYAFCVLKNDITFPLFDWMTRAEIDAVRRRSRAANDGPWVTDYERMAVKTVIRRASKQWPKTVETARALNLDEHRDFTIPTELPDLEAGAPDVASSEKPSALERLTAALPDATVEPEHAEPKPRRRRKATSTTSTREDAKPVQPPEPATAADESRARGRAEQAAKHEIPRAHQARIQPPQPTEIDWGARPSWSNPKGREPGEEG
jgi:recombination protein RecT